MGKHCPTPPTSVYLSGSRSAGIHTRSFAEVVATERRERRGKEQRIEEAVWVGAHAALYYVADADLAVDQARRTVDTTAHPSHGYAPLHGGYPAP